MSTLLGILTRRAFSSSCTYRRTIFTPIFWSRSIATPPAGLPGRGRSSVRSVFHGQFNVWPGRNQVSVIFPQFAFVPLTIALISSSLPAAPFAFHNAIFIGVWSFLMSYRGASPVVWRSGPDTTLFLLGRVYVLLLLRSTSVVDFRPVVKHCTASTTQKRHYYSALATPPADVQQKLSPVLNGIHVHRAMSYDARITLQDTAFALYYLTPHTSKISTKPSIVNTQQPSSWSANLLTHM